MAQSKKKKKRSRPSRVKVRRLSVEDYDRVCEIQLRCFPGMKPWLKAQFESQIERFPDGQIGVEVDGTLVASSSSLVVDFDLYSEWHNWTEMSGNGYITNHTDTGDTMYGIEIMVDPDFRGQRLSRRLYDARKQLARKMNLARIMIGGRIPGYHKHAEEMSAEAYTEKVMAKVLHDPVLTAQIANGFSLKRLIPDYLPVDSESCGYASFLEWTNFDRRADERRYFRAVEQVRLAVVQYELRPVESFEEFAKQCTYFVDVAADSRADFVVFPGLVTAQLFCITPALRPGLAARKLAEFTPQYEELMSGLAIRYNINIIGGSQFTIDDGNLRNTAFLFRRDGSTGRQHKLHIPPAERRWWGVQPGTELEVFETDSTKIAILGGYDIQFPELSRCAAKKGARVLFVPFASEDRNSYMRIRYCAQARCIENHVYTAISGSTGNLPFVDNADVHYAQSAILTPCDFSFARDGIAAECTPNIEAVQVHDLDIELLRRQRFEGTTTNWYDRRKDIYRLTQLDAGEQREV